MRLPAIILVAFLLLKAVPARAADTKPNIVVILTDNVGYGEVSCYDNSRMVQTPVIDNMASQGLRLTNFNVETWCAPSRSALLTGRFGIRSGTSQLSSDYAGMTGWEVTLAELLSKQGYATAIFGKWHLGNRKGRFPIDQGFDEFWGIANSWDEGLATSAPGFIPKGSTVPFILSGKRGGEIVEEEVFDGETGKYMDRMLADKSIDFIQRMTEKKKPFFLYVPVAAVHLPVYVDPDFEGKSGAGAIGDAMMSIDHQIGRILNAVRVCGIFDNTLVIVTSDDGPEYQDPYRGTAGPWSGCYNTAMEGALRTPFILRWPARVPAGRTSNEIVHICDLFTTLAHAGGAEIPKDRPIDGVDQTDFFTGKQEKSNRESFPVYLYGELAAVKWQDWKLHFFWKPAPDAQKQIVRKLFNLRSDPKEEYDVFWQNDAMATKLDAIAVEFQKSLEAYPSVPAGAPEPWAPPKKPGGR